MNTQGDPKKSSKKKTHFMKKMNTLNFLQNALITFRQFRQIFSVS